MLLKRLCALLCLASYTLAVVTPGIVYAQLPPDECVMKTTSRVLFVERMIDEKWNDKRIFAEVNRRLKSLEMTENDFVEIGLDLFRRRKLDEALAVSFASETWNRLSMRLTDKQLVRFLFNRVSPRTIDTFVDQMIYRKREHEILDVYVKHAGEERFKFQHVGFIETLIQNRLYKLAVEAQVRLNVYDKNEASGVRLALKLMNEGHYRDALDVYETLKVDAPIAKAAIYEKLKQPQKAIEILEKEKTLNDEHKAWLARLYRLNGRPGSATKLEAALPDPIGVLKPYTTSFRVGYDGEVSVSEVRRVDQATRDQMERLGLKFEVSQKETYLQSYLKFQNVSSEFENWVVSRDARSASDSHALYKVTEFPRVGQGAKKPSTTFYEHPEFPEYLRLLKEMGYEICIDPTISLKAALTGGYHCSIENIIGLKPDSSWQTFIHEFNHAVFRVAVDKVSRAELTAAVKGGKVPEGLPEPIKKHIEKGLPLNAANETHSVEAELNELKKAGVKVLTPEYMQTEAYALRWQIEELSKIPVEELTLRQKNALASAQGRLDAYEEIRQKTTERNAQIGTGFSGVFGVFMVGGMIYTVWLVADSEERRRQFNEESNRRHEDYRRWSKEYDEYESKSKALSDRMHHLLLQFRSALTAEEMNKINKEYDSLLQQRESLKIPDRPR